MDRASEAQRIPAFMIWAPTAIVAVWLAGCAGGIGTTATSFLQKVQTSPDPNVRFLAYSKLASPNSYDNDEQKVQAARVLSAQLVKGKEPVVSRALICRTLGELGRPEARAALLKTTEDAEPTVRGQAIRALGKVGLTEDATLLAQHMNVDGDPDCRIAAIEAIGSLKPHDPRIEIVLVDGMESGDPAIRLASLDALRAITHEDLGSDPKPWRKRAESQVAAASSSSVKRR